MMNGIVDIAVGRIKEAAGLLKGRSIRQTERQMWLSRRLSRQSRIMRRKPSTMLKVPQSSIEQIRQDRIRRCKDRSSLVSQVRI